MDKVALQRKNWQEEISAIQNAAYLVHFSASDSKQKASGTLEIYYLRPDTMILFSPGFFGKGSLRGRWILGESLLVYFPHEKSYFKGGWESFLLNRKKETQGLDSLIFGILSRKELLPPAGRDSPDGDLEKKNGWIWKQNLGGWQREHIFGRRGRLSGARWHNATLELEVELDGAPPNSLSPRKVRWRHTEEKVEAKFSVEEAVLNGEIPPAKVSFSVPKDAVRLEKVEPDEKN